MLEFYDINASIISNTKNCICHNESYFCRVNKIPYIHRDISWLSFNYRVLQEAKDPSVPLLERLRFLAIYSNNLDEFFRVRVANHRTLLRTSKKTRKALDFPPEVILEKILKIVKDQQEEFSEIFEEKIVPQLANQGIQLIRRVDLVDYQKEYLENYFADELLPFVQPVLLNGNKIKPFLSNRALYLAILLKDKSARNPDPNYAIVKIPSDHVDRFLELPTIEENNKTIILLDDVVRHSLQMIFPGYDIIDSYSIKLTRDAELYIDDEFSGDLIAKIRKSVTKRHIGPASRLVYDRKIPDHFLEFLTSVLDLSNFDLLPEGRYHNNSDFFSFPDFGKEHLSNISLPPIPYKPLEVPKNIFAAIKEGDHLINFPFNSYTSVVRFFEQASSDPLVTHIKIVQYRVSKKSKIMDALSNAVRSGKNVSAFIEVKARFDEENNLKWGEYLEKAGVQVNYSMPGLKVHSKMALVRRIENGSPVIYTYLSTGNFHEDTAKIYTDMGLFTASKKITSEVTRVFSYLETKKKPEVPFKHLLVGQFGLKQNLLKKIDNEVTNAKDGFPASITLKVNSIQDEDMVNALYHASKHGVKITLICRGICSIVAGIPGISENITAFSIVDRFLEHTRIYIFENKGDEQIYISSADWMSRNLEGRVETAVPIYDKELKQTIKNIIKIQMSDNIKSRSLHHKMINEYRNVQNDLAIRSQSETYYYIKRLTERLSQNIK